MYDHVYFGLHPCMRMAKELVHEGQWGWSRGMMDEAGRKKATAEIIVTAGQRSLQHAGLRAIQEKFAIFPGQITTEKYGIA